MYHYCVSINLLGVYHECLNLIGYATNLLYVRCIVDSNHVAHSHFTHAVKTSKFISLEYLSGVILKQNLIICSQFQHVIVDSAC